MSLEQPSNGPIDDQSGFTLVELLVGIALLSLLTIAILASVRFATHAWNVGITHTDRLDRMILVQSLAHRLIGGSYPLYVTTDPTRPHVAFDGTKSAIDFLGPTLSSQDTGGRMRYRLSTEQRGGHSTLILASRHELADRSASTGSETTTLVERVDTAEFSYFGQTQPDRQASWQAEWSGQRSLPSLVRIRVAVAGKQWPDLIVRPQIQVDAACIYDPLTKRCRGR